MSRSPRAHLCANHLIAILPSCLMGGIASTSRACECGGVPRFENFYRADLVFTGKVIGLNAGKRILRWWIVPAQRWKGEAPDTLAVYSAGSDCDFPFELGRAYLIYASWAHSKTDW